MEWSDSGPGGTRPGDLHRCGFLQSVHHQYLQHDQYQSRHVIGRNSGTLEIITTNSDHPIYLDHSGNAKTVNIVAESIYRSGRRGPYPMTAFYANIVHGTYDLNVANTSSGDIVTLSGNEGNNILVGRKNGSFLYGSGGR